MWLILTSSYLSLTPTSLFHLLISTNYISNLQHFLQITDMVSAYWDVKKLF